MRKSLILILIAVGFVSCNHEYCSREEKTCTEEFRSITVKFQAIEGAPVIAQDFKVFNNRTKQYVTIKNNWRCGTINGDVTDNFNQFFTIADDSNLGEFSEGGDIITVSAKNPNNGVVKSVDFKISGNECACHVEKIYGPEIINF